MSEMTKRVAAAIHGAITDSAVTWDEVCEMAAQPGWSEAHFTHKTILAQAIAAIAAMREPTDEMVAAMWNAPSDCERVSPSEPGYPSAASGTVGSVLEYDNQWTQPLISAYRSAIDEAARLTSPDPDSALDPRRKSAHG